MIKFHKEFYETKMCIQFKTIFYSFMTLNGCNHYKECEISYNHEIKRYFLKNFNLSLLQKRKKKIIFMYSGFHFSLLRTSNR